MKQSKIHAFVGAVVAAVALVASNRVAFAIDFYVDSSLGNDAHTPLEAQSPSTPWATINHALQIVTAGSVVHVQPGTYGESAQTKFDGVILRAEGAPQSVIIAPPVGTSGLAITNRNWTIRGVVIEGGVHGIRADGADGLDLRGVIAVGQSSNGISILNSTGVIVENSRAISAGSRGILLDHSGQAYVRNNLVYGNGEWGISFENTNLSNPQPPLSTGNVVAFNTVAFNGSAGGGVRLLNATGEIRDNVIVSNGTVGLRIDTAGAAVHHNDLFGNPTPILPSSYAVGGGMLALDPMLVAPAGNDQVMGTIAGFADDVFALSQTAAGQGAQSQAVDAGSGAVSALDIGGSTRTDGVADAGTADLGFHSGAPVSAGIPPVTSGPATYYVNATTGDDTRNKITAQSPATPWQTINHALSSGSAASGDTVLVAAGTYAEAPDTNFGGFTLRATGPAVITPPSGAPGLSVAHPGVLIDGFTVMGGVNGVSANAADGLTLRRCTLIGQSANGVSITGTTGAVVDSNLVTNAASRGILLRTSSQVYVRNNLVTGSGEWGIHFDNSGSPTPAVSTGNVMAFNTVVGSGRVNAATGGLRFQNAVGEIRDNIVANNSNRGVRVDTAPTYVHHNDVFGSATAYDTTTGQEPVLWSNLAADPLFNNSAGGDYTLQQTAAGQAATSPAVDAGSGSTSAEDISGSTRSDRVADGDPADMGYHYGASPSAGVPPPVATPTPTPAPTPTPPPGQGTTYYIDCAAGDDSRTTSQAQSPATPWRTIQKAANTLNFGDVALVAAGTCAESVQVGRPGVTLKAQTPLSVSVVPPAGSPGFNVKSNNVTVDGFTIQSNQQGVLAANPNSGTLITNVTLRNLSIQPPAGGSISTNGMQVRDAQFVTVENCIVTGAAQQGILLKRVQNGYAHNNLVYGQPNDWGISFDNTLSGSTPPLSDGNLAAFNTLYGNKSGLRFVNSAGEIRDNIAANNTSTGIKFDQPDPGTYVHHNDSFGNTTNYDAPSGFVLWADNLHVDPLFVAPASGNFALAQTAAGQGTQSPLVDAGSAPVAIADISGSTRTDGVADGGTADMGFHSGAAPSSGGPGGPTPTPTASVTTVYVDCASGDNTRSKWEAQHPWTPWKTIQFAASALASGEVAIVKAGVCNEQATVTVSTAGVSLKAETASAVTVVPPIGAAGFNVQGDGVLLYGFIVQSTLQGVLVANQNAGTLIQNVTLRGLVVQPPQSLAISTNGIQVRDAAHVTVENCIVSGATQAGILMKRVQNGYVHNNLVTGSSDWGISFDNTSSGTPAPPSTGNTASFNTVYGNQFGLRFLNSAGEIRENIAAGNALTGIKYDQSDGATVVHHNDAFGSTTNFDLLAGLVVSPTNKTVDPQFIAAGSNFKLSQTAAGQATQSPAVDAGSAAVGAIDIDGTTRSDGAPDTGIADLGYHAGASGSTTPPGGPSPTPSPPSSTPAPGSGAKYYIDAANGDDSQSGTSDAPWKTIGHAIAVAAAGDVLNVNPGTYAESVDFNRDSFTLQGNGDLGTVIIAPPQGSPGININGFQNARVVNIVVQGGSQGILAAGADGIDIRNVAVVSNATNGIQVRDSATALIENSIVTGAGTQGILLKRVGTAYVRNNLLYANANDWAISLDNTNVSDPQPPLSTGNVVAFNTVHANGSGVRLLNASGEVRDNDLTSQFDLALYLDGPNILAHHNNFSANGRDRDQNNDFLTSISVWGNIGANPRYVSPAGTDGVLGGAGWLDDNFLLKQTAAGQSVQSPAVDAGSGPVSALDISGTTATNSAADGGTADIGFHYAALASTGVPPFATPPALSQFTYYVNATGGDDTRTNATARDPSTPWLTIGHALQNVAAGDAIVVAAGTYAETAQITTSSITLVADTPGSVVLAPPSGNGVTVQAASVTVDGFVIQNAVTGVSAIAGADDVTIRNCAVIGATTDGIRAASLDGALIESSIVTSSASSGILLRNVTSGTVRNNLTYDNGDWGISLDNSGTGGTTPPVSSGNLIASNTSDSNASGNLKLTNAIGELRDNLLTGTPGVGLRIDTTGAFVHHNGFLGDATQIDPDDYLLTCSATCVGNIVLLYPPYVNPAGNDGIEGGGGWADDDFRLSQTSAGQAVQSDAVDAGSGTPSALGVDGTTATSGVQDTGLIDLGYHYDSSSRALPTPPAPSGPTPTPAATPSPSVTPAPTPSPTLTPTPTASPTPSATPSATPTATPTPTPTPSPSPIPKTSPTPTAAPTATASPTPTPSPKPTATPTATQVPTPTPTTVFNDATTFVKWQYIDILLRQGSAGEMAPFVSALNGGTTTRANVIDSLEGSSEFGSQIAPIIRLYYSALTRSPVYGGLTFWVGQRKSGVSLQAVADSFAATQAFQSTYGTGTPRQFVNRLFQNVLGRSPTTTERRFWVAQVKSGAATRSQAVLQISESAESVQTSASKVFVTSLYVGMLRRAPTNAELSSGITTAKQSHINLINSILSSQEYRNRVFQ